MTNSLLEAIVSHPLAQTVGWALVHSVWQGALVALAFAAANRLLRESSAQARYVAGCAALALLVALPLTTVLVADRTVATAARVEAASPADAAKSAAVPSSPASVGERLVTSVFFDGGAREESAAAPLAEWAGARFESGLPWLALVWAGCVALLAARLAGGWARVTRMGRARRNVSAGREWEQMLARLARGMKINRAVRLCRSALVEVPTVVGWLRPVILVPVGALAGLTPAQVEAVLAHELAHVRRHDYLVNLLQTVVETVLFFHPAAWWISGRVRAEREHACDDLAVEATGDVLLYARALAALEESRQGLRDTQFALAANGGSLVGRIHRLVRHQPANAPRRPAAPAALAAVALSCAAVFAHAAAATRAQDAARAFTSEASAPRAAAKTGRRVAVTFVALPMVQTWYAPRAEKDTRKLLAALAARGIRSVGFVQGGQLYKDGAQVNEDKVGLLRMWLDAGHELGSEGYAHPYLYKVPLEDYKRDILRGEELTGQMARERGMKLRYFSYPFLNVGPDRATKEAFERWIAGRGMQLHKVTIDNWDWLYGKVYADARRAEDETKMGRVGAEYVEYMERAFEFYEQLSRDTLGYEPPQVLMLTANALNCHKAEELLAMMERRGYSFVTLEEAMSDPAYRQPDTYTGEWGISWLQRWAMARGKEFRDEPYLSDWMAQFHERRKQGTPGLKDKK